MFLIYLARIFLYVAGMTMVFGYAPRLRQRVRMAIPRESTAASAAGVPVERIMAKSQEEIWVTVALEEYKTLRAESLVAIQNLQAIVRYGTTALGVLFGLGLSQLGNELGTALYGALIPLFSVMLFLVWSGEFGRMVRVGCYIESIESRLSSVVEVAGYPPGAWVGRMACHSA